MRTYIFKHKVYLFFSIMLTIINASLSIIMAFILANIVNSAVESDVEKLKLNILLSILYFLASIVTSHLANYICEMFTYSVMLDFKRDLFISIINRNYVDFNKYDIGHYMEQITTLSDEIKESYVISIFGIVHGVTLLILSTLSIILIDYKVLIIALTLALIYLFIGDILSRNISRYKDKSALDLSKFSSTIKDLFEGYDISRNYDNTNYIFNRFNKVNGRLLKSIRIYNTRFANLQVYNLILGQGLIVAIITICSFQVLQNNLKIGALIAIAQLLANMINPLLGFAEIISDIKSNRRIKDSLLNFIKYENHTSKDKKYLYKFENKLEIKDLSFSYENKKIFNKVNLSIESGNKYAVIGENGTGKSTLLKLITSCYKNYDGEILIDGNDIKSLSTNSFKDIFAVVDQDIYVYDDTIANNIYFSAKHNKDSLLNTINKYKLNQLNVDYDLFTHNAKKLSGGEKQKVAIARSKITQKPIMIFDEINSKLDGKSSKEILEVILKDNTLTAIVVTHRLDTENLEMYDSILKVKDNKIEEIKMKEYLSTT